MGCASSKRVKATVDVYRLPPTSFAIFDVNSVEEPWLKNCKDGGDGDEKNKENNDKAIVAATPRLLEKLNAFEEAPRSWDEVSKALEDLKPTLNNQKPNAAVALPVKTVAKAVEEKQPPRKTSSFHTLEELDAKLKPKPEPTKTELKRSQTTRPESTRTGLGLQTESTQTTELGPRTESTQTEGYKPVSENIFLLRDRMERGKNGNSDAAVKFLRDPLSDFPEKCPPGGADAVVLYTTSLGGVRRTFEDCNNVRSILESHRVVFDERDVALHGEFRTELRELLGEEGAGVPRLFVKGRYVGGAEEVVSLNDTSRLGRILSRARVERGVGRIGCDGCGGASFVPCFDCGGSCKVVNGDKKERCGECNENGLVHCPICH